MPNFVNDNSHPIRVRDNDKVERRLIPGQVVQADGAFADRLTATAGVRTAESSDEKAWDDAGAKRRGELSGPAHRLRAKMALGPMRTAVRALVAAPLRRVIGDDAAPHGPGTGTVTTKAEVAAKSPEDRQHFAPNEALPGESVPVATDGPGFDPYFQGSNQEPTEAEVFNAQAQNAAVAEQAAREMIPNVKTGSEVESQTGSTPPTPATVETTPAGDAAVAAAAAAAESKADATADAGGPTRSEPAAKPRSQAKPKSQTKPKAAKSAAKKPAAKKAGTKSAAKK